MIPAFDQIGQFPSHQIQQTGKIYKRSHNITVHTAQFHKKKLQQQNLKQNRTIPHFLPKLETEFVF